MAAVATATSAQKCGYPNCTNTKLEICQKCMTAYHCGVAHRNGDLSHKALCTFLASADSHTGEKTTTVAAGVLPMKEAVKFSFPAFKLDQEFDEMLEKVELDTDDCHFATRMTIFAELSVFTGFDAPFKTNKEGFGDYINKIAMDSNITSESLFKVFQDKESSRLHRQYAAFALYVQHDIFG